MRNRLALFVISFFLFGATTVFAELKGDLVLDPLNPAPYSTVSVTLSSYDFDVNNSTIVWTVNGKTVSSGPGVKQISITTGGVGVATTISARATAPDGEIFTATMALAPASVDLTWESPESYVPPFYEGRSLPAEGALVRVNAIPHMSSGGRVLSPGDVSFNWYKNDEFIDSASGRGKQSADIPLEYLTDITTIKVVARAADGTSATKSVDIAPNEMVPLFYSYDPILGIDLAHAISKRFETTKEFTLRFVPYFFSLNGVVGKDASFTWSLDGLPITTEDDTTVTLRPKEKSFGSRTLMVHAENSSRILQTIDSNLDVVFDTR